MLKRSWNNQEEPRQNKDRMQGVCWFVGFSARTSNSMSVFILSLRMSNSGHGDRFEFASLHTCSSFDVTILLLVDCESFNPTRQIWKACNAVNIKRRCWRSTNRCLTLEARSYLVDYWLGHRRQALPPSPSASVLNKYPIGPYKIGT
jgi:hypothetical protein